MKKTLGVLALLTALLPAVRASASKPVTEPFHYREDFESGEARSWASYPPAQDVAWNPSLVPASTQAQGHYSLLRTFEPVRAGRASFGMIKRIEFLVSASSRLKFAYLVHSYSPPESLRVVLCGADGKRYSHVIPSPAVDRWEEAELPVDRFLASGRSPQPELEVQAIYWELDLAQAAPEDRYFLYLDNLEVFGERAAELEITAPQTFVTPERQTPLARKHYLSGDTVSVEVRRKSGSPKLTAVTCTVQDATGKSVGRFALAEDAAGADRADAGSIWANAFPFRIEATLPRGIWKAEITAATAEGRTLSSHFEFLVTDPWPREIHPRLYFRQGDRERLFDQTRKPETAQLWAEIQADARRLRTTVHLEAGREIPKLASNLSFDSIRPYLRTLGDVGALVQTNAFVYWLTGDTEAKEAAKRGLLEACQWETWTYPWFTLHGRHTYYPVGVFTSALAFGYDLLYPELTLDERELVRRAILEKAVVPAFREYYLNNQIPFPTSNWIGHTMGGPLIGLLAVSENPDQAEPCFSALLKELREHWQATYLEDGSYGEGIDYQRFDLETSSRFLAALKNVLHVDLADQYKLAGSFFYPLYAFLPPDRYLDFGDTADRLGSLTPWAWLVSETRDPYLKWYYEQYWRQRDTVEDARRPSSKLFDFLWHDPQPASKTPVDLPASRYFPAKGGMIFRSGWSEDVVVLNFTAGPFFNHNHLDQGSFWLAAFGEILLAEAGITDYYADEFYQPYFIQCIGHNVLLVDGDPASQRIADQRSEVAALDRFPRIATALLTEFHDQVRAELSPVYEPALTGFARTIMFVKPHYFVLLDQLESADRHRYSQLFHPEFAEDLAIDGAQAWVRKDKAELWMKFLSPHDVQLAKRAGHIPFRDIERLSSRPLRDRAYLEAGTPEAAERAAFLVLLFPKLRKEAKLPTVEKIEAKGLLGLRLQVDDSLDRIGFALQEGIALRYEDIATDSRSFRVSQSRGENRVVCFEQASYFELAGKTLFRSEKPISGVRMMERTRTEWRLVSPATVAVELSSESKPAEIVMDGKRLALSVYRYDRKARALKLTIMEGAHTIAVRP